MITITVETDEEEEVVRSAIVAGILQWAFGRSSGIRVQRTGGGGGTEGMLAHGGGGSGGGTSNGPTYGGPA